VYAAKGIPVVGAFHVPKYHACTGEAHGLDIHLGCWNPVHAAKNLTPWPVLSLSWPCEGPVQSVSSLLLQLVSFCTRRQHTRYRSDVRLSPEKANSRWPSCMYVYRDTEMYTAGCRFWRLVCRPDIHGGDIQARPNAMAA
jgi:hypothetical protein